MKRSPLPRNPRIAMAFAGALALASILANPAAAAPRGDSNAAHRWAYARTPGWLPGDPASAPNSSVGSSRFVPGLWIALDPVTRRPTAPTAEQRRAAQAALAPLAPEKDEVLPVERIPGGGELIHLNGRHMVFSVARRDASGHFTTTCAADSVEAARILTTPLRARPREER